MNSTQNQYIQSTLKELFKDSKYDYFRIMKGAAKAIIGTPQPSDFKDVYLSISKEQGEDLVQLIKQHKLKNIVEFGTSFGISTLYLAEGALATKGHIVTTELIDSKAKKATENFKKAGVNHLIEVRSGDAMKTLKNYDQQIDLLLLDGWKDLYLPLFKMLEVNFTEKTFIYVDNADMMEVQQFIRRVRRNPKYKFQSLYNGKVVLISLKK